MVKRTYRCVRNLPRILRLICGVLLIIGGILGIFLPIIGFWMTPLGLAILAIDIRPLLPFRRWMMRMIRCYIAPCINFFLKCFKKIFSR